MGPLRQAVLSPFRIFTDHAPVSKLVPTTWMYHLEPREPKYFHDCTENSKLHLLDEATTLTESDIVCDVTNKHGDRFTE